MKTTRMLHELGQSLWIDNLSRDMLNDGTLENYIENFSVTGQTSNPTIFEKAIKNSSAYDDSIAENLRQGDSGEDLFFDVAIDDIRRAADMFRPIHDRTDGVDGWVSLEVSPALAYDTAGTVRSAKDLYARVQRPNVFIKIPGTPEGVPAIEESIFAGVPVNVTLLFSREQYIAAAEAYLRGIERRIDANMNPQVASVASVFVSRWDVAVADKVPEDLRNKLGVAVAQQSFQAFRSLLCSPRWLRAYNFGARPQRLLWASTGTKDPNASKLMYVEALAAPFTINTLPDSTLDALAERTNRLKPMAEEGADTDSLLARFAQLGIDLKQLATQLQKEGAASFSKSWKGLMQVIQSKAESLVGSS